MKLAGVAAAENIKAAIWHLTKKIEHYMLTYPHAEEPPRSIIKTPAQIEGIRKAGEINSMVLDSVAEMIGEGVSTQEIDDLVAKRTANLGGICACLGYQGYPKNVYFH